MHRRTKILTLHGDSTVGQHFYFIFLCLLWQHGPACIKKQNQYNQLCCMLVSGTIKTEQKPTQLLKKHGEINKSSVTASKFCRMKCGPNCTEIENKALSVNVHFMLFLSSFSLLTVFAQLDPNQQLIKLSILFLSLCCPLLDKICQYKLWLC